MKNEDVDEHLQTPTFSKTAREWMLSSALYDGIEDEDIRQIEKLLSERGANPNVLLPEYGIAPFHLAVANDSIQFGVQATDVCLQHGADPNVRSEDGLTPVHLAAMWGRSEVLQLLLFSGGDPWLVDCYSLNALDYARNYDQTQCIDILQSFASRPTQPSPGTHYQLTLKRVILYKNDLQITYEALPSPRSQKCASTQTPPSASTEEFSKQNVHGSHDNDKASSVCNQIIQCSVSNNPIKKKSIKSKCKPFSLKDTNCANVSNRLKKVIINHRRNSTIFEHYPVREEINRSEISLQRELTSSKFNMSSVISELMDKLEKTNRLRQSLKSNSIESRKVENVTHRRKPVALSKLPELNEDNGVSGKSVPLNYAIGFEACESGKNETSFSGPNDSSNQIKVSGFKSEIGFEKFDPQDNSVIIIEDSPKKCDTTVDVLSSPSVNFVLDNLEDVNFKSRGSSLFSDIASDVKAITSHSQPIDLNVDDIITEDESNSSKEVLQVDFSQSSLNLAVDDLITEDESNSFKKVQQMDSTQSSHLCPYMSCLEKIKNENESSEFYESCIEEAQQSPADMPTTKINGTEPSAEQEMLSLMDSVLVSLDSTKTTPVNHKLITSTPEKQSGTGNTDFLSAIDHLNEPEKRKWVEAKVSSSEESEHYISVSEEYEYTDLDEGIVLIEKHHVDSISPSRVAVKKGVSHHRPSSASESEVSTLSGSEGKYDTDELRRTLHSHGFPVGPINGHTKRVYLRQLKRLKRRAEGVPVFSPSQDNPGETGSLDVFG